EQPRTKRVRTVVHLETVGEDQSRDLARILCSLDEEFAEKEQLSEDRSWCAPILLDRKISTVQAFYKSFHDPNTLPIRTCAIFEKRGDSPLAYRLCFPPGESIPGCANCVRHLRRDALSAAAQLDTQLGCEHIFLDELKGLSLVEEKLIALNSCYGFITKFNLPEGHRQTMRYPKHVKGHITVFPNNVQELATNVLPHPLLKVMDEIHVSWQGQEKPAPSDLSVLLSVRPRVVERALRWLKRNNSLYKNNCIDVAEMER
ncbi:hypothetical protein B0H66DRAFT_631862, partial [Apodospora peruviana]